MNIELATGDEPAVAVNIDSPESTSRFRRRTALYCMLVNTVIVAAMLIRNDDIGPNAMELLSWVVFSNGLGILGAIGFKAWETLGVFKGRRT